MSSEEKKKSESPNLDDVFNEKEVVGETNTNNDSRQGDGRRRKREILNLKCPLCESGTSHITYKDVYQLKKFTSVRGKIIATEKSGVCSKHQRQLRGAIKRARFMALLPYVAIDA